MNMSQQLSFFFSVGDHDSRGPVARAGQEPVAAPPRPAGPWVLAQTWHDLLFMHWPVAPEVLRPHLPAGLTLDTINGQAWIAVLPFWMSGIRARGCPPVPFTSSFAEINVRTYVHDAERPAVFFMSLDADNVLGTTIARHTYHLPYTHSRIRLTHHGDTIDFASDRTDHRDPPAMFAGSYRPVSEVFQARPGSLEHWLVERYRFYTVNRQGDIYRGDIQHAPWPLQRARAEVRGNTMALSHNVELPAVAPLLHYARRIDATFWLPQRVGQAVGFVRPRLASYPG